MDVPELDADVAPAGWKQRSPPLDDDRAILRGREEEEEGEEGWSMSSGAVCGLVEVMVVLWEVVEDRLKMKTHSKLRQRLISRTEKNLPVLVGAFPVSTSS